MKGTVKTLCDIESIVIPEDMLDVSVDPARTEEEVKNLALRYAKETEVNTAEIGDIIYCEADKESYPDGRKIILYTGTELPGAKEAAAAAVKKSVGDVFKTTLEDKAAELKIVRIVRRIPAEVNDGLVASIGIDGVSTVNEYREYINEKNLADLKMERGKELSHYIIEKMEEGSVFEYSNADFEEYYKKAMEEMPVGDGFEMDISPEELRASVLSQLKLAWMAKAFCDARGIEIDEAAAIAEADQMAEMMGLMGEPVPSREELIESSRENAAMTELFGEIDKIIEKKMGGANGNG